MSVDTCPHCHKSLSDDDAEGIYCEHCGENIMRMPSLRVQILTEAQGYDPDACWATDDPDEDCLLVQADGIQIENLLELGGPTAYEDPNDPPTAHTRLVFPGIG